MNVCFLLLIMPIVSVIQFSILVNTLDYLNRLLIFVASLIDNNNSLTFGLKWMNWSFIYPRKWILQLCLIIIIIIMKWKKMAFHEWLNSERLMKSPIVTGNLFSVGKIPTTPEIKRLRKRRWHKNVPDRVVYLLDEIIISRLNLS